jgi:hypothetical protein
MDEWQNAPPTTRIGGYDWPAITAKLRTKPGRWLLVREQGSRSIQSAIRRGRISHLRDDEKWEYIVRTRNTNGTRADIWMSARRKKESEDATTPSGDAGSDGD